MPFKSKKQKGFLFANHPEIAKRWAKETEAKHSKGGKAVKGMSYHNKPEGLKEVAKRAWQRKHKRDEEKEGERK